MKKEKIEELYINNSINTDGSGLVLRKVLLIDGFTQAIKQARLEWYRESLNNLIRINGDCNVDWSLLEYIDSIHDKIKELEQ